MEVARSEALTNAHTARKTGQATDTHICLLAPEHARREVKIIADLNEVAERERLEATNPSQGSP